MEYILAVIVVDNGIISYIFYCSNQCQFYVFQKLRDEVRVVYMSSKPAGGDSAAPMGLLTHKRRLEGAKEDALEMAASMS